MSQIECDSPYKAPEGCTQYFTANSGTIYSYGYPNELDSQENTICIRSNAKKCKVDYAIAGGTSPDPFEVGAATGMLTFQVSFGFSLKNSYFACC